MGVGHDGDVNVIGSVLLARLGTMATANPAKTSRTVGVQIRRTTTPPNCVGLRLPAPRYVLRCCWDQCPSYAVLLV